MKMLYCSTVSLLGLFFPKGGFFCPIAGIFCLPKEVFLLHCWDCLSPKEGILPIAFYLPKEVVFLKEQLFKSLKRSRNVKHWTWSHWVAYKSIPQRLQIKHSGIVSTVATVLVDTKTKAVSYNAATKSLRCSVTPKVVCKWKLEWYVTLLSTVLSEVEANFS